MSSTVAPGEEKETEKNKRRTNLKFVHNDLDCTVRKIKLGIFYPIPITMDPDEEVLRNILNI